MKPAPALNRARLGALGLMLATAIVDQASKYWVLNLTDLPFGDRIAVMPTLDLVLTWNQGISYGLFRQDGPLGRWLLVGATVVAIVLLAAWLLRAERRLVQAGLALIVGGAIGNLVDRVVHGAVVDFVYFHVLDFSWYVFNLADCAIVAGVAALLYDSFRPGHTDASKAG
jgi:signal peptidase II